jgi:hypothetical protein
MRVNHIKPVRLDQFPEAPAQERIEMEQLSHGRTRFRIQLPVLLGNPVNSVRDRLFLVTERVSDNVHIVATTSQRRGHSVNAYRRTS